MVKDNERKIMRILIILGFLFFVSSAYSAQQNFDEQTLSLDCFINKEMLRLALIQLKKYPHKRKEPLQEFKAQNPELALLLRNGTCSYSLSINDLLEASGTNIFLRSCIRCLRKADELSDDETEDDEIFYTEDVSILDFSKLSLTSIKGLHRIGDISKLVKLDLKYNQLETLDEEEIIRLRYLKELNYRFNKLKTFSIIFLESCSGFALDVGHNPLDENMIKILKREKTKHALAL